MQPYLPSPSTHSISTNSMRLSAVVDHPSSSHTTPSTSHPIYIPQLPPVTSFRNPLPKLPSPLTITPSAEHSLSHHLTAPLRVSPTTPTQHPPPRSQPPHSFESSNQPLTAHLQQQQQQQYVPSPVTAHSQLPVTMGLYSNVDVSVDQYAQHAFQETSPVQRHEQQQQQQNAQSQGVVVATGVYNEHVHVPSVQQPAVQFSPLSSAQPFEAGVCVSPLSMGNVAPVVESFHLPVAKVGYGEFAQQQQQQQQQQQPQQQHQQQQQQQGIVMGGNIDDSLIAKLRGSLMTRTASSMAAVGSMVSGREPMIRDTTENLVMGMNEQAVFGLDANMRRVHPSNGNNDVDRPYGCKKCSATFRRKDNLMAHIRAQHKGERPFRCEICGFRFIKKDHAMKHWKVVHLKERPFECERCGSRFGQRSDLNKHVKSVHLKIKPFSCQHCGMRFSHRGNQIRHQTVVHEKKKPFRCSHCNSSFAEKSNLLKHCQAVHKMWPTNSTSRTRRHPHHQPQPFV